MAAQAVAAVLAAGAGARFGATKQLAELEGRPLVAHVVDAAVAAGCDPVLLVVGHDAAAVAAAAPRPVTVVTNDAHATGQATSLHAAVEAAEATDADVLVVLLADEPTVRPTAVGMVLAAHEQGATVARAVYDDRPGHPVGFHRSVWPVLAEARGDVGARQLLDRLDVVDVPVPGRAPVDVDTAADLDGLR